MWPKQANSSKIRARSYGNQQPSSKKQATTPESANKHRKLKLRSSYDHHTQTRLCFFGLLFVFPLPRFASSSARHVKGKQPHEQYASSQSITRSFSAAPLLEGPSAAAKNPVTRIVRFMLVADAYLGHIWLTRDYPIL